MITWIKRYQPLFLFALILIGLILSSVYSYLLFHSLVELFSILVGLTTFILTWNTQRYINNGYLEFVGIALLFISGIDLVHTLAYKGMGVLDNQDANPATQLWLAARYLQSVSLLLAPLFLRRPLHRRLALVGFSAVLLLVFLSILSWKNFPTAYVEGVGLTSFKHYSEYIISLLLLVALWLLYRDRRQFAPDVYRWLAYSILASTASELAFSDYVSVYGAANLVGHLLKIVAFYLIYKAIIETGFIRPYDLLFWSMKESEESLRDIAQFPDKNPNPVLRVGANGDLLYANRESDELIHGWGSGLGQPVPEEIQRMVQKTLESGELHEMELELGGRVMACTLAPFAQDGFVNLYCRDITGIKRAERNSRFLAELSAAMVRTTDPEEAIAVTVTRLGEFLNADRCFLDEVDLDREMVMVHSDYHPLLPSAYGEHSLSAFPDIWRKEMAAGRLLIVDGLDDSLAEGWRDSTLFTRLEMCAWVSVPRLKEGRWVATLTVATTRPRAWREEELSLLHSVTGRAWLAVDNARLFEELRQSEQLARTVQERLTLATEAAQIGTWDWDLVHDEFNWDDACRAVFGLQPGAQVSFPIFIASVHPEERECVEQAFRQALHERKDFELEYRVIWPDGSLHWILGRGLATYGPDGLPLRMNGISMDITPRKQIEEQIQRSAARDQILARISKVITLARLDSQAVLEEVAQVIGETLGDLCLVRTLTPDRRFLITVAEYHSDPEAHALAEKLLKATPQNINEGFGSRVILTGEPVFIPVTTPEEVKRVIRPEYLPWVERFGMYSIVIAPLTAEGEVIGMLVITRDQPGRPYTPEDVTFLQEIASRTSLAVTNARLYQDARRELLLRRQADAAMKEYSRRLARSNRELQDFAFIASHDLQEPLRKILAFGDRLQTKYSGALEEEGVDYLERMQRSAARMQAMLNSLLDYSRLATQAQPLVPVDLNKIAREAVADLEMRLEETGGQVALSNLPTIEADPHQMQQLFMNLIGNALKFHQEGEEPVVKVYSTVTGEQGNRGEGDSSAPYSPTPLSSENTSPETIELIVEDNGIGLDEKYLDRIFQPFQRLHSQNEFPGSGMGLAICQKIVERHHGSITARSRPGEGARFVVTLPVNQSGNP